jgi:hypothetical protein
VCDVVLHEVVLATNVFGFVAHQCVMRVSNGALVVSLDGGGVGGWDALDLAKQVADVNGLSCCVSNRIVFGHTCRLRQVYLLCHTVAHGSGAKCNDVSGLGLALFNVVAPVCIS